MIHRFYYSTTTPDANLAFDTSLANESNRSIRIFYYVQTIEIDTSAHFHHWRIAGNNAGSWVGWTNPSVQYLRRNLLDARLDGHSINQHISGRELATEQFNEWSQALYDHIMDLWSPCGLCHDWNCPDTDNEDEHSACENCGHENLNRWGHNTIELQSSQFCGNTVEELDTCSQCEDMAVDGLATCEYSGSLMANTDHAMTGPDGYWYCEDHWHETFYMCSDCEVTEHVDDVYEYHGYSLCETCYEERGGCTCEACDPRPRGRRRPSSVINSWDYRPHLIFHPSVPTNPKKPLYIGMELEISFRGYEWKCELSGWYNHGIDKDLIYIKSDSSVQSGAEFVTHPMEPRWALKNFPFDKFDDLINDDALLAHESHSSAGTHIHMNKEAFTTAHLWKFLQIHYRMSHFLKLLGGREDTGYASFQNDTDRMRKDLLKIVKEKDKGQNYDRYAAVNLRNEHTIELRYPASGCSSKSIKKNIELALALYEFSDYVSIEDVRNGAIDDAGYFLEWITAGNYEHLQAWIEERLPTPKKLKERSH